MCCCPSALQRLPISCLPSAWAVRRSSHHAICLPMRCVVARPDHTVFPCPRNGHVSRICPKKRGFWTYPHNVFVARTYQSPPTLIGGPDQDAYKFWTYSENVSKKPALLDISLFLPPEEVQKLRIQKNTLPTSF